jgi:hypothetical protein
VLRLPRSTAKCAKTDISKPEPFIEERKMELNQIEISVVAQAVDSGSQVVELVEMQLALVGGGMGETVL